MTAAAFRRLALQQPGAVEGSHQGHADFRRFGKVFATLDYPEPGWAMIKLAPRDQAAALKAQPAALRPAAGAWGRGGATLVNLEEATIPLVRRLMAAGALRAAPAS